MVGSLGKPWKYVNTTDYIFLEDIEEQRDGKIQQLSNTYLSIMGPRKNFLRPGKALKNLMEIILLPKNGMNPFNSRFCLRLF